MGREKNRGEWSLCGGAGSWLCEVADSPSWSVLSLNNEMQFT